MLPGMAQSPHEASGLPWHLLCPQSTLAVSAESLWAGSGSVPTREVRTPKHPWVSSCPRPNHSQKRQQRKSTGCWAVCSRSSSEMERRQQDRWLLPEFRTHASSGLASGTSSPDTLHHNPSTWLGEVKPVKKPNWWSGTQCDPQRAHVAPAQRGQQGWLVLLSHNSLQAVGWLPCPGESLPVPVYQAEIMEWGNRGWDVLTNHQQAEPRTGGREDKSSGLQILLRLSCYEQHRDKSLSYLWQLRNRGVTGISANLLIWGMLEASHPQIHGEVWTGRDPGTFFLHPSAQSTRNSETSLRQQTEGSPRQTWWGRCQCLSRHPVQVHSHLHKGKFFLMSSWHFPCHNLWPIAACPFVPVDNTQETSTQWLRN